MWEVMQNNLKKYADATTRETLGKSQRILGNPTIILFLGTKVVFLATYCTPKVQRHKSFPTLYYVHQSN